MAMLRDLREATGLTQQPLASKLLVSEERIEEWGEWGADSMSDIWRVPSALGLRRYGCGPAR